MFVYTIIFVLLAVVKGSIGFLSLMHLTNLKGIGLFDIIRLALIRLDLLAKDLKHKILMIFQKPELLENW